MRRIWQLPDWLLLSSTSSVEDVIFWQNFIAGLPITIGSFIRIIIIGQFSTFLSYFCLPNLQLKSSLSWKLDYSTPQSWNWMHKKQWLPLSWFQNSSFSCINFRKSCEKKNDWPEHTFPHPILSFLTVLLKKGCKLFHLGKSFEFWIQVLSLWKVYLHHTLVSFPLISFVLKI